MLSVPNSGSMGGEQYTLHMEKVERIKTSYSVAYVWIVVVVASSM